MKIKPRKYVVILIVVPSLNSPMSLATKDLLKIVIISQYVPRLFRIYPLYKEVTRTSGIFPETPWAGAVFNLVLYLLFSHATLATRDNSCEPVVTSGQQHLTSQHPPRDASPAGLLSIADETSTEFLSKATGTAVEWVQMPGMKPGPDSMGIITISHCCIGIA